MTFSREINTVMDEETEENIYELYGVITKISSRGLRRAGGTGAYQQNIAACAGNRAYRSRLSFLRSAGNGENQYGKNLSPGGKLSGPA